MENIAYGNIDLSDDNMDFRSYAFYWAQAKSKSINNLDSINLRFDADVVSSKREHT